MQTYPLDQSGETAAALRVIQQCLEAMTLPPETQAAVTAALSQLSRASATLTIQAQRYRALFEHLADGCLVTDAAGVIQEANAAAAAQLGVAPAALVGQPLSAFVAEDMRAVFAMRLARLQAVPHPGLQAHGQVDVMLTPVGRPPFSAALSVDWVETPVGQGLGLGWLLHDVTTTHLAEDALKASEARLKLALEAAREGWYDRQLDVAEMYFSPTYYTLLGYEPGDFLPPLEGRVHPVDWPVAHKVFEGDLADLEDWYSIEFRMRAKTGEWRWLLGQGQVVARTPEGRALRTVGTLRDITRRKHTEELLQEREELYRALFEKNRALKLLIDPETGAIVAANPAACEFYGYSAEKLQTMRITDINILPAERVRAEMQRASAEENLYFVFPHRLASGEIRDVEVYTGPIEVQGRRLLFSILHDFTERKRAEDALRESEVENRALIDAMPDLMFVISAEGVFLDYHAANAELLFLPPEQFLGRAVAEVMPVELVAIFAEGLERLKQGSEVPVYEYSLPIAGEPRYYEIRFVGCGDYKVLSIVRDITRRKLAEAEIRRLNANLEWRVQERTAEYEAAIVKLEAEMSKNLRAQLELQASEEQYRALVETSPDSIIVCDLQGTIRMVNMQTVMLFGYAGAEAMLGQTGLNFLAPSDRLRALAAFGKVLVDGSLETSEYTAMRTDGTTFEAEIRVSLVKKMNSGPDGILIVTRDVTERRQMEAEVRRLAAGLERRVAERTRELEALYKVMALGGEMLDLQTILKRSLALVLTTVGGEAGTIHLLEIDEAAAPDRPDTSRLTLAAQHGLPEAAAAALKAVALGQSGVGQVAQQREPLVCLDLQADLALARLPALGDFSAYVGAPMRARGRKIVGVLSVFSGDAVSVSVEAVTLLASIADQMGGIVENAWLRRQAESAAVMEERQRLARELHDSVTQALYSLVLIASAAKSMAEAGNLARLGQHLDTIDETAQLALREMRLLIHALRPPILEQVGLAEALRLRLGAVEERVGLKTQLTIDAIGDLAPGLEAELYSMALEALNNALKHAQATLVTVRLASENDAVVMEIGDDGRGFDLQQALLRGGLGLTSLRERVEKLGGELAVLSATGGGSKIRVKVPRTGREA
jgi:PAS domain S-box-containing protein